MIKNLTKTELEKLIKTVFALSKDDRHLAFFMDLPNDKVKDSDDWADTRKITYEWFDMLNAKSLDLEGIEFYAYENVGSHNNDLPEVIYKIEKPTEKLSVETIKKYGEAFYHTDVLKKADVVIAPTFFSCTAPLKVMAKKYDFRAATMPGFKRDMIPALGLDYDKVALKVNVFTEKLDKAQGFKLSLEAKGKRYDSYFDLRYRKPHASTGLIREKMMAANLPSGEAYIVPYEGERENEQSKTKGELPVQFGKEIVLFKIENNRAQSVEGDGPKAAEQRELLKKEPAYGNIAEVGIGVLGEFGVKACGSVLLDEKLGVHIAFGRSEHFGGIVSPKSFNDPKNVVHQDWVYVRSVQPMIKVLEASFEYEDGEVEKLVIKE